VRINRRDFLKGTALMGAGLLMGAGAPPPDIEVGQLNPPPMDADVLAHFVDPLPIPSLARPAGHRAARDGSGRQVPYYRMEMREFACKVHRDLRPTRMWGYGSTSPGPTFDLQSGQDIFVEWVNLLPKNHMFAVDTRLHGAEAKLPRVRTVVHVHGARTALEDDGYPEAWFTKGKSAVYYYPNRQDAASLWYHDHALGITRLNIFAGLLGAYIVRDAHEDSLHLPDGRYDIPLMIYDRSFDRVGQLDYPIGPIYGAPWVPEFSGNAILVNGKLFPYLEVEARRYRFRIANVSNGRIFRLSLSSGHPLHQIASDQGLLTAPVQLHELVLAAAERVDVVIDFAGLAGKQIVLRNDDHEVLQFRISPSQSADTSSLPATLRHIDRLPPSRAAKMRMMTLDEETDSIGRVIRSLLNETRRGAPITETPMLGTSEIWGFINLTKDAHPIHLHGVRFQILDRRPFDASEYKRGAPVKYTGGTKGPEANEAGWKDIVRVDPGTVARIIIPFEAFSGIYSWHCHILEHEDNEMMRPFKILDRGHHHKRHPTSH
jgi:spore coat protein A